MKCFRVKDPLVVDFGHHFGVDFSLSAGRLFCPSFGIDGWSLSNGLIQFCLPDCWRHVTVALKFIMINRLIMRSNWLLTSVTSPCWIAFLWHQIHILLMGQRPLIVGYDFKTGLHFQSCIVLVIKIVVISCCWFFLSSSIIGIFFDVTSDVFHFFIQFVDILIWYLGNASNSQRIFIVEGVHPLFLGVGCLSQLLLHPQGWRYFSVLPWAVHWAALITCVNFASGLLIFHELSKIFALNVFGRRSGWVIVARNETVTTDGAERSSVQHDTWRSSCVAGYSFS